MYCCGGFVRDNTADGPRESRCDDPEQYSPSTWQCGEYGCPDSHSVSKSDQFTVAFSPTQQCERFEAIRVPGENNADIRKSPRRQQLVRVVHPVRHGQKLSQAGSHVAAFSSRCGELHGCGCLGTRQVSPTATHSGDRACGASSARHRE